MVIRKTINMGYNKEKYFLNWEKEKGPIVIHYSNETDEELEGVIFGFDTFFNTPNFGSDERLKVINLQGGLYDKVFAYSKKEIKFNRIRIQSAEPLNLEQDIIFWADKSNGNQISTKVGIKKYHTVNDLGFFDKQTIDIKIDKVKKLDKCSYVLRIDGSKYYKFKIKPKSTIVFSFYEEEKLPFFKKIIQHFQNKLYISKLKREIKEKYGN